MLTPTSPAPSLSSLYRLRDWPAIISHLRTHPSIPLYTAPLPCGHTPLQLAALLGATTVVAELLRLGLPVDASALFHAAHNGHVPALRLLTRPHVLTNSNNNKEVHCDDANCLCSQRVPGAGSALHAAAWRAHRGAVLALLEVLCDKGRRSALMWRAADGGTPLHAAALDGDEELAVALVDAGAMVGVRDASGRTARDWARRFVVATGTGQGVVRVLKEAEEREKKPVIESVEEMEQLEEGVDEMRLEEDPRFKERAPCVPRVQQPTTASASPACHAV